MTRDHPSSRGRESPLRRRLRFVPDSWPRALHCRLRQANDRVDRDPAEAPVIILDLAGMDTHSHRDAEFVHGISHLAPTSDGRRCAVKDRKASVPDDIDLLATVARQLLAHERAIPRSQLKLAAVTQFNKPLS